MKEPESQRDHFWFGEGAKTGAKVGAIFGCATGYMLGIVVAYFLK